MFFLLLQFSVPGGFCHRDSEPQVVLSIIEFTLIYLNLAITNYIKERSRLSLQS